MRMVRSERFLSDRQSARMKHPCSGKVAQVSKQKAKVIEIDGDNGIDRPEVCLINCERTLEEWPRRG